MTLEAQSNDLPSYPDGTGDSHTNIFEHEMLVILPSIPDNTPHRDFRLQVPRAFRRPGPHRREGSIGYSQYPHFQDEHLYSYSPDTVLKRHSHTAGIQRVLRVAGRHDVETANVS